MSNRPIRASELILNPDGSVYHLHLKAEHIAPTVLLVGDQGRVQQISRHFDRIDYKISNREFITHTGTFNETPLTVLSTGIGTENIDIAINELDAAMHVNPVTRKPNKERKPLNLVRIGTSGALHKDIPVGSFVISQYALGFDGLLYYYDVKLTEEEQNINEEIIDHLRWDHRLATPYVIGADPSLYATLKKDMVPGITATATGFYAPQGRYLYNSAKKVNVQEILSRFKSGVNRVANLEMETSALYALARLMGHRACTCCAIIANRETGEFSSNYKKIVDDLIELVLERLTNDKFLMKKNQRIDQT